ncbi:HTH_48 domain-containing protein [Trichonephila clavipes]|nr:HTH_48 domain-containing protein [Trichonephila clavipes]
MGVTRVEQRAYIKIAVLQRRNAMEYHKELVEALWNNALPYRLVAQWVGKFQQRHVSISDEQRGAENAETDGIQRLSHRCDDSIKGLH